MYMESHGKGMRGLLNNASGQPPKFKELTCTHNLFNFSRFLLLFLLLLLLLLLAVCVV